MVDSSTKILTTFSYLQYPQCNTVQYGIILRCNTLDASGVLCCTYSHSTIVKHNSACSGLSLLLINISSFSRIWLRRLPTNIREGDSVWEPKECYVSSPVMGWAPDGRHVQTNGPSTVPTHMCTRDRETPRHSIQCRGGASRNCGSQFFCKVSTASASQPQPSDKLRDAMTSPRQEIV